ncbi:hypothetical protein [Falsiroseomonas sp.]|uniref:hypothetical protein n=1 Tax=Falsiroseomonas sp. TaxID=2870721 RepID=UPI003F72F703
MAETAKPQAPQPLEDRDLDRVTGGDREGGEISDPMTEMMELIQDIQEKLAEMEQERNNPANEVTRP